MSNNNIEILKYRIEQKLNSVKSDLKELKKLIDEKGRK